MKEAKPQYGGTSKPSLGVLEYRLRCLSDDMSKLAYAIGESSSPDSDELCCEMLKMRDSVWFTAKRLLPPNDQDQV